MPGVCVWLMVLASAAPGVYAADSVRVGVLKFGTVNWELDTVIHNGYDRKNGLTVTLVPFANKQATPIAFFNDSVDMFVSDWLWALRVRAAGKSVSFIPYSKSLGAIMVPRDSRARTLSDLAGLRVGVAGGSHDKSWILLRTWAKSEHGLDLLRLSSVEYAAPPLLNGQIRQGHLDAVLNFWHYCARLESAGYRRLFDMGDALTGLGISNTPMVGYIFKDEWARTHNGIVERFNLAVRKARERLLSDDAEWLRLRPLMKAPDDAMFVALRERYREGVPRRWGREDEIAARKLTRLFHATGGKELTSSEQFVPGTFWTKAYF